MDRPSTRRSGVSSWTGSTRWSRSTIVTLEKSSILWWIPTPSVVIWPTRQSAWSVTFSSLATKSSWRSTRCTPWDHSSLPLLVATKSSLMAVGPAGPRRKSRASSRARALAAGPTPSVSTLYLARLAGALRLTLSKPVQLPPAPPSRPRGPLAYGADQGCTGRGHRAWWQWWHGRQCGTWCSGLVGIKKVGPGSYQREDGVGRLGEKTHTTTQFTFVTLIIVPL